MALNARQQRFVDEYLVDLNATQAAIRAGYSERTAKQQGSRLLTNAVVAAAISEGQQARSERTGITSAQVVERLAAIALTDISAFASWSEDGELVMVASDEVSPHALAALREVRSTTSTVVFKDGGERTSVYKAVKTHDPIRALELLGRHLGMFAGDGLPDGPIEVVLVWPEQAAQA